MFQNTIAGRLPRRNAPRAGGAAVMVSTVYVTRFCAVEAASLAAAVRDGLRTLDGFTSQYPELACGPATIVFRNRRHDTITLDIGLACDGAVAPPANGEIRLGRFPVNAYRATGSDALSGRQLLVAAEAVPAEGCTPARPRHWPGVRRLPGLGTADNKISLLPRAPDPIL
jgi:hypothetical protein